MFAQSRELSMTDISSVASSASSFVAKQTADLNKAAGAASVSFSNTLSKVQNAVGLKPRTGFTAGPTFEANTLAGQTKAAVNNALAATKSALHIKP
jgi:hypothetical protein